MHNLNHSGSGDNVAGNKYENIIRSVQARDLMVVTQSVMLDVCRRELEKAENKLNALEGISALETDVQLLLKALRIKVKLAKAETPSAKSELLALLKQVTLPDDVREVVISILIDLESKTSAILAKERYADLAIMGVYCKEIFYERLASKEELKDSFQAAKIYDLSEQELTGFLRGAIRLEDFFWALELAQRLNEYFPSNNSVTLLLFAEVNAFLDTIQNQQKDYISLTKDEKNDVDILVSQCLEGLVSSNDDRYVIILINLLSITGFADKRLFKQAQSHLEKIRQISIKCAEEIDRYLKAKDQAVTNFELVSDVLNLEQFAQLDFALQNNHIKAKTVSKWLENAGAVLTGDDHLNAFIELYLNASVCSIDNKQAVQYLDKKAQIFYELNRDKFPRLLNPYAILQLCEKFIDLGLFLHAAKYLTPFLSDKPWVSPLFLCYLDALFCSGKFDLFLSKVRHLEASDKTVSIYLQEARVYELLNEYDLSIASIRAALKLESNSAYAWLLLLHVSRAKGLNREALRDIVFEIPEIIFQSYCESKVPLIGEIAAHVDINLADRILVDWFAQNPTKTAKSLIDIHLHSLNHRTGLVSNPYQPLHCCDGVTYSDGFETVTRLLVRDVNCTHPLLLDIESPLGKTLNEMQAGDKSEHYTMIERLPSYVAAFRNAADIRHKGNDGSDVFRMFTLPSNDDEMLAYLEKILRLYSDPKNKQNEVLNNSNIPLMMRAHYTDKGNPVRGAITHLLSSETTQHMRLAERGEKVFDKVIIDFYTAVYLALMGLVPSILNLNIVFCQHTKRILSSWLEDIQREDYMSLGVSEWGIYRITSEDIQKDSLNLINALKALLEHSEVETLKPIDTPEPLVKIRDMVDFSVYSTFQLSFANNISLLCIDHWMLELAHQIGCPTASIYALVQNALNFLSLRERKKSIELNLLVGTPAPILYQDIVDLSCSSEPSDMHLVFKFMEKYGKTIHQIGDPLLFLTHIVRNVTITAYIDGNILSGGRRINPRCDGHRERVFNACCRIAMNILVGKTAEQKLAMLIFNVINIPSKVPLYTQLIFYLASEFAEGHFLNINACNEALTDYQIRSENKKLN